MYFNAVAIDSNWKLLDEVCLPEVYATAQQECELSLQPDWRNMGAKDMPTFPVSSVSLMCLFNGDRERERHVTKKER